MDACPALAAEGLSFLPGSQLPCSTCLRKIGVDAVSMHIPWIMDEVGMNNVSAGTALSALETLAAQKAVLPGTAHLLLGLGIGASYQAHIIRFGATA